MNSQLIQRSSEKKTKTTLMDDDFDWSTYSVQQDYTAPKQTGISLVGLDYDTEDTTDLTYKATQVRAAFYKGTREKLIKNQTKGFTLYCALGATGCYMVSGNLQKDHEIVLVKGKEVWTSKSNKVHETSPPIDHYNPTWKNRLDKVEAEAKKGNWDVKKYQVAITEAYNQDDLRVIHMYCNSKLPKS